MPLKKHTIYAAFGFLFGCLGLSSCVDKQSFAREDNLNNFFDKRDVTIAVTDSGLGGLSILAESVEKMKENKIFRQAHFIFFNSLFSEEGGYNSLKTQKEKVLIFDSALKSLVEHCSPDLKNRAKNTEISVRMVSMVKIGEQEMLSIGRRLDNLSPQTAEALQNFELRENLFSWKEFVTSER